MTQNRKELILGAAIGYSFKDVELFVRSLKQTGYQGDACLFVSNMNKADRDTLNHLGVQTVPCRLEFPYIIDIAASDIKHFDSDFSNLKVLTFRMIIFYLYLMQCKKRYSHVLITDVFDVVFQKDPFDFKRDNASIYFFCEDKRQTLRSCRINSAWILKLFGEEVLSEIGDNPIVCAGITIGTHSAIIDYLRNMVKYFERLKSISLPCEDQAIHNYLIHKGKIRDLMLFNNEDGPVLHLHHLSKEDISFNDEGDVVNEKGKVVNIVHQYTGHYEKRHPFLTKIFRRKYCASML